MKTAPISITYLDHMGSDLSVVNAARVSFAKESAWQASVIPSDGSRWDVEQVLCAADAKLIKYLATHDHWSPFAHTSVSLRVKAPIFLARQLVKHTVGCAWNEVSRRYVDDEPEFWFPSDFHDRPEKSIKQGASDAPSVNGDLAMQVAHSQTKWALKSYQDMLELGIAPEEARMVLPLNTMTEWIWTGSLVYWARVYKLRSGNGAQAAAGIVAESISKVVKPLFPASWEALA